jgi:hypothetical protein
MTERAHELGPAGLDASEKREKRERDTHGTATYHVTRGDRDSERRLCRRNRILGGGSDEPADGR